MPDVVDLRSYCADRFPGRVVVAPGGNPDCGAGWNAVILELVQRMATIVGTRPGACVSIVQAKEKYGGLRCYSVSENLTRRQHRRLDAMIDAAEERSYVTCETCGAQGSTHDSGGWIYVACPEHARGGRDLGPRGPTRRGKPATRGRWTTEDVAYDPRTHRTRVIRRRIGRTPGW